MVFNEGASTYLCTGVDQFRHQVPTTYTAAHCISGRAAASTLNTCWFNRTRSPAIVCSNPAVPAAYQRCRSDDDRTDNGWHLAAPAVLLLPPALYVLGWNASVIPTGTTVVGIHHPEWRPGRNSRRQHAGVCLRSVSVRRQHATLSGEQGQLHHSALGQRHYRRGGSSGSGVFTTTPAVPTTNCVAVWKAGAASCSNLSGIDRFSRMDLLFTRLSPHLARQRSFRRLRPPRRNMVEYFNPQFNFYFISSRESEKRYSIQHY